VTIATRFGPYPNGPAGPDDLPPAVDPRQSSLLGAAWTAASIGELAAAWAASVTFFETAGWRGVVERDAGNPMPGRFASRPGQTFPLAHPIADAAAVVGSPVLALTVSDPLVVGGFAAAGPDGTVVVVANLTPDAQRVRVSGLAGGPAAAVRILDDATVDGASTDPGSFRGAVGAPVPLVDGSAELALGPYAVARIHAPRAAG
jgi:D-apionolactonase